MLYYRCSVVCVNKLLVVAQCVALSSWCDMSCVTFVVCDELLEPSVVMMCMKLVIVVAVVVQSQYSEDKLIN